MFHKIYYILDITPPTVNSLAHDNDKCALGSIQNVEYRNLECEKRTTITPEIDHFKQCR